MLTSETSHPHTDSLLFPLIFLEPIADISHQWLALSVHLSPDEGNSIQLFNLLFAEYDFAAVVGRLQCVLPVADPLRFEVEFDALLPASQIVLRVPVECWSELGQAEALLRLHGKGFKLLAQGLPRQPFFLNRNVAGLALDYSAVTVPHIQSWIGAAAAGTHLAEDVNDQPSFEACQQLGFSWFAGEYGLRLQASRRDPTSRLRLLSLLDMLACDADSAVIEQQMKQDPALSYQLFKLVSSAAFGLSTPITNYRQALDLIGRRQLQRWLQLLLYARHASDTSNNPLLPRAAARAGLMEALCKTLNYDRDEQDRGFIVGMFSLLSLLLGLPIQEIASRLKLPADVLSALTERDGRLGQLLNLVERAEFGQMPLRHADLADCGLSAQAYCQALMHAYRWAAQVNYEAAA